MKRTADLLSQDDRIRLRAAELYRERGHRLGSAVDDWLRAEKEIREADKRSIDEALGASGDASAIADHPEAEGKNKAAEAEILGDQGQSGG